MSDPQHETWKNATRGRIFLKKYNQQGQLAAEMVPGGKVFQISPTERRINTEMAASPDLDFFQNGQLTPVRLIETEEDAKEIASNPNLMAESDMVTLFKGHWKTFEAKVNEISNLTTLKRLLEIAQSDEVDAKVRQVEAVKARISDIDPVEHVEIAHAGSVDERTGLKPVTPR
jgi:hypothetical protein